MASARISFPCHSDGRKGSGGAFRITNQQTNSSGLVERVHYETRQHLRPGRMKPELERGDHAEVAPTAPNGPEEIGRLGGAGAHHLAAREHDLRREQVVY